MENPWRGYEHAEAAEPLCEGEEHQTEGAESSPMSPGLTNTVTPPLALFCPTCPQPGINIPDGWDKDPKWWLYIRKFCADGNFKADHLNQINPAADVYLTNGEGFMTAPQEYNQHVKEAASKAHKYNHVSRPPVFVEFTESAEGYFGGPDVAEHGGGSCSVCRKLFGGHSARHVRIRPLRCIIFAANNSR